jgi:hypothetical protein
VRDERNHWNHETKPDPTLDHKELETEMTPTRNPQPARVLNTLVRPLQGPRSFQGLIVALLALPIVLAATVPSLSRLADVASALLVAALLYNRRCVMRWRQSEALSGRWA